MGLEWGDKLITTAKVSAMTTEERDLGPEHHELAESAHAGSQN